MFRGFDKTSDDRRAGRLVLSALVAAMVLGSAGYAVVAFASGRAPIEEEPEVDVTFRKEAEPPPVVAPPPPPAVPKDMKVTRVKTPRPVASLAPAKEVEKTAHEEADPTDDAVEIPDGEGGPGGQEGGTGHVEPPPPPPPPKRAAPVNIAENDTPPIALDDNEQPEYPAAARAKGLEGLVILKVGISDSGKIISIQAMKGEEPFLSAALAAVKKWRYRPAVHPDGQVFAAFMVVKIPFRLTQ